MKIGIVGYSSGKFDEDRAKALVDVGVRYMTSGTSTNVEIVSGLTNVGIPKIAYEFAVEHDYRTVGIACEQANEFDCFPVDEQFIVGKEWGDESQTFIDYIDCLIRIGGGEQSLAEVAEFRKQKPNAFVLEFELAREEHD